MHAERHVRLFRNGKNQAVRIPREFEFDAREVIMRREDDRLVIEPVRKIGLLATLALLQPLEEEFPDIDAGLLAPDDVDL
jgi:antitoxin VapB